MPLAAILGMCLLLPWPQRGVVPSVRPMAIWQSVQSQDNQPNNSSPHSSSAQSSADPQQGPGQSATAQQTPVAVTPSYPENSRPGSTAKAGCKSAESTQGKIKKRPRKTVAPAGTTVGTGPIKKVVRNGGAPDPTVDLSPGLSPQQAFHQMESANQLLAASTANLKRISGRQLSASQQDAVKQINSYMEQANTAKNDRDFQRAYNLALKANLLSAELAAK